MKLLLQMQAIDHNAGHPRFPAELNFFTFSSITHLKLMWGVLFSSSHQQDWAIVCDQNAPPRASHWFLHKRPPHRARHRHACVTLLIFWISPDCLCDLKCGSKGISKYCMSFSGAKDTFCWCPSQLATCVAPSCFVPEAQLALQPSTSFQSSLLSRHDVEYIHAQINKLQVSVIRFN